MSSTLYLSCDKFRDESKDFSMNIRQLRSITKYWTIFQDIPLHHIILKKMICNLTLQMFMEGCILSEPESAYY